ncbi:hypothetical protein [Oceanobacillus manasiensis]|uniref:hypothetical protein n=1 Tax=Oceanobacillus manasiensis TaxID=586413 RepID=UPI000B027EDC|nr:hypothetical protein [Oceanobacillus manasiensis]
MLKMKKLAIASLTAILSTSLLIGCSDDEDNQEDPATEDSTEQEDQETGEDTEENEDAE